jgi:hypothetical protein
MTNKIKLLNLKCGQRISFIYNDKCRFGVVEYADDNIVNIKHDTPELYDNKQFSNYSFKKLQSPIYKVEQ